MSNGTRVQHDSSGKCGYVVGQSPSGDVRVCFDELTEEGWTK